ncbi:MAG: SUF system NifU family Fe-S cluster assembly protein [Actinomycetes bacterium]|jgi:nitrogen fixation NifU-like protein
MELDSLYQEVILDHYKSPKHKGLSEQKDVQVHHNNPSCGDEVTLNLVMDHQVVKDISWDGVGCSISMASTSVMSELLIGKNYQDAIKILDAFVELMQSKGKAVGDEDLLEDGVAFAGVSKFPARIKCALLGWMAFKDASTQVMA